MERAGAEQSRALKAQLLGEEFQIDAGELSEAEKQILAAQQARMEGIGQMAGGVGTAVGVGLGGPSSKFFENIGTAAYENFTNP